MNIDAKAREIAWQYMFPGTQPLSWEEGGTAYSDLVPIIAAALLSVCNEAEAATWAAAETIARDYDDWTFWGQYDNAAAAQAASMEIAEALAKRRPLTTDEISALDTSKGKSAGGQAYVNRVRNETLERAAKVADGHWETLGGGMPEDEGAEAILDTSLLIAARIRALMTETPGSPDMAAGEPERASNDHGKA